MTAAPIRDREGLLRALTTACELEHGLSLQYLFAAFTLRADVDDGLSGADLVRVRTWASSIFFVAAQEMFHLALASNLLLAVGGVPHLARPNFPQPAGRYPPDLGWQLTGFDADTLDRFIAYESALPGDPAHESIGEMYEAIAKAFSDLPHEEIFRGDPSAQITAEMVDFPLLVEVTGRETAIEACRLIMVEGEGSSTDHADCHEGVFRRIRRELDDFTGEPARRVASDPTACGPAGDEAPRGNPITDPLTLGVQEVCNDAYDVLVLALFGFFAGGSHDPAAPSVKTATLELMTTVIRPLGDLLTRLAMGPRYGALTAGPSFEIGPPVPSEVTRDVLAQRLDAAAAHARQLADEPALKIRHASVLDGVAAGLERCAATLIAG